MKSLVPLLCLFFFQSADGQRKQLPIRVLESTLQRWVSGAPGGRTGIKYSIKIYIRTYDRIEFVNLWLGRKNVPFDVEFYSLHIQKKIQKGDSVLITYNEIRGQKEEIDSKPLPFNYNGSALIEAKVEGKTRYFIVTKIKEVSPLLGM
jgi:hypothetical protein